MCTVAISATAGERSAWRSFNWIVRACVCLSENVVDSLQYVGRYIYDTETLEDLVEDIPTEEFPFEEIATAARHLKPVKASGTDAIPPDTLSDPNIINQSIIFLKWPK